MKKILLFACIILLCFAVYVLIWMFSSFDRPGTADNAQIDIGSSERFTQEEIESAADLVVSEFGFLNSELIYLWYDESISDLKIENSYLDLDRDSTIIFFSTIVVSELGGPGFLSPGTMEDIGWVLVKEAQSGEWELLMAGFSGFHF